MLNLRRPNLATSLLLVAGLGMITGLAFSLLEEGFNRPAYLVIGAIVSMALTMAIALWSWKGYDEAAREAHKSAWWWGSTFGLATAFPFYVAVEQGLLDLELESPMAGLRVGIVGALAVMSLGYFVFWAGWWLGKR